MTVKMRRALIAFFVVAALAGVVLLVVGFLTQKIRLVSYEEALVLGDLSADGSTVAQLITVDETQTPSSSSFVLSTDLQSLDISSNLPPLKKSSDFVTKTAQEVSIVTNRGTIILELYGREAPYTITNFLTLIDEGFYDGLKFHRFDPGFVIQIGDPASREADSNEALLALGSGGPGYRITDEISPALSHDQAGMVAMANLNLDGSLPDTAGSQFYITLAPATYLDGRYAIFAKVVQGLDVVNKLQLGDTIERISYQ